MLKMSQLLMAVLVFSAAAVGQAGETISTDHKLTYVKLSDLSNKERARVQYQHPFTFADPQMRAILSRIKLNRAFMLKEEIHIENAFTDRAIEYLTPRLVEAFRKADKAQKVVVSYVSKEPEMFVRRDYLHIVNLWVDGEGLHFEFDKLWARLIGDTDKRGYSEKSVSNARSGRISLELGPHQKFGGSTREVIFDVAYDYAEGKELPTPESTSQVGVKPKKKSDAKRAADAEKEGTTTQERLEELAQLKEAGLITEKEYEAKRKAILEKM